MFFPRVIVSRSRKAVALSRFKMTEMTADNEELGISVRAPLLCSCDEAHCLRDFHVEDY